MGGGWWTSAVGSGCVVLSTLPFLANRKENCTKNEDVAKRVGVQGVGRQA